MKGEVRLQSDIYNFSSTITSFFDNTTQKGALKEAFKADFINGLESKLRQINETFSQNYLDILSQSEKVHEHCCVVKECLTNVSFERATDRISFHNGKLEIQFKRLPEFSLPTVAAAVERWNECFAAFGETITIETAKNALDSISALRSALVDELLKKNENIVVEMHMIDNSINNISSAMQNIIFCIQFIDETNILLAKIEEYYTMEHNTGDIPDFIAFKKPDGWKF